MCSRTFGGTNCKKKDKLKCHIGFVHYGQKIKEEIERLFEGNKCTVCMKDLVKMENKRKHLIFNHSKYVDEILSLTNETMKASNIVTKNIANETKYEKKEDENRPYDVRLVPISELRNQTQVFAVQQDITSKIQLTNITEKWDNLKINNLKKLENIFKQQHESFTKVEVTNETEYDNVNKRNNDKSTHFCK